VTLCALGVDFVLFGSSSQVHCQHRRHCKVELIHGPSISGNGGGGDLRKVDFAVAAGRIIVVVCL
jgi:hypothetical protein